jgi:uncharacterized protein YegP (UPF0339 family)
MAGTYLLLPAGSEAARDHGIASCKENGPSAATQDKTK